MFLTREQMQERAAYCFRFEGQQDLALLLIEAEKLEDPLDFALLGVLPELIAGELPRFHAYVHSNLTLIGLKRLMGKVPNGEVMVQTVNHANEYTGGRQDFDSYFRP